MSSLYSSPYKTPTKSKRQSDMSLSEISSPSRHSGVDSKHDQILEKIHQTKAEISILSAKTDAYAKNSTMTYNEYSTPTKNQATPDRYKKSPYGKELGISDYSGLI